MNDLESQKNSVSSIGTFPPVGGVVGGGGRRRLTNDVWEQMLQACEHKCLKCGNESFPMSQDHVVPVADGGASTEDNVQPLCLECNQSKGVRAGDYRPENWPWKQKPVVVAPIVEASVQLLADMERIDNFLKAVRTKHSSFSTLHDPHLIWQRIPGDKVKGECMACSDEDIVLTQAQVDKSVDNMVSAAHVAWHLAKEMMIFSVKVEKAAMGLYNPVEGPR